MRQLRTLAVVHKSLVPPESLEGHSEKEIEEVRETLQSLQKIRI